MKEINKEMIMDHLVLISEEAIFDEQLELVFKKYYGVDEAQQTPKEISKTLKIPMKKLKIIIEKIEKKVFNVLKKHESIGG